jgi:hypothetical protein
LHVYRAGSTIGAVHSAEGTLPFAHAAAWTGAAVQWFGGATLRVGLAAATLHASRLLCATPAFAQERGTAVAPPQVIERVDAVHPPSVPSGDAGAQEKRRRVGRRFEGLLMKKELQQLEAKRTRAEDVAGTEQVLVGLISVAWGGAAWWCIRRRRREG